MEKHNIKYLHQMYTYSRRAERVKKMNIDRLKQTLNDLNNFGATDKGITRLAYSEEDKKARSYIINLLKEENLKVRVDECGNIFARRDGEGVNHPVIACGSHIDTVVQGGRFDGTLGVVSGLEILRTFNDKNIKTKHPIELIIFACEESSRFGFSTLGSKAVIGAVKCDGIAHLKDKQNISLEEALKNFNLNFKDIHKAKLKGEVFKAFLELHVEQGPVLEKNKKQIGIVKAISAPTRIKVLVKGVAAHSGSTTMDCRKDALSGASEIALALEHAAQDEIAHGTVATVGVLEVEPGAMNVIPGLAKMQIDIRGIDKESKNRVLNQLYESFEKVKKNRSLEIEWELIADEDPVTLDEKVIATLEAICLEERFDYIKMPSGAGHDAMNMAKICPTGMIFVPSKDGLSHNPNEYTSWKDIEAGVKLLEETIKKLAVPVGSND